MSVPISRRPGDWLFVGCFAFFAFSSFFSDAWHALDLLHGDSFWARANRGYVEMAGDEFLLVTRLSDPSQNPAALEPRLGVAPPRKYSGISSSARLDSRPDGSRVFAKITETGD